MLHTTHVTQYGTDKSVIPTNVDVPTPSAS
jgi:hypothetical protein